MLGAIGVWIVARIQSLHGIQQFVLALGTFAAIIIVWDRFVVIRDKRREAALSVAVVQNLTSRVWHILPSELAPLGLCQFAGVEHYFDVFNSSYTDCLEGVRAEVVDITPNVINHLPVPLHIKNEDYSIRECNINPRAFRQFDIATGPTKHVHSQELIIIAHTVNNERLPLPLAKYNLTVRVSANNTIPVQAYFELRINEAGELVCFML